MKDIVKEVRGIQKTTPTNPNQPGAGNPMGRARRLRQPSGPRGN